MKKILCLLLVFLLVPSLVLSEETLPLSELEQGFVGGWVMYATLSNGSVCHYTLTFLDDRSVYFRTLIITDGVPTYNEISSGQWVEFLSGTILLTLSGKSFIANIKDDGVLRLIEYDSMTVTGVFSSCPDLSYLIGS